MNYGACEKPTKKYPDGRTGTRAGASAHRYAGESPCAPCRVAWNEYRREWRNKRSNAGICQECTRPVVNSGGTYCADHLERHNQLHERLQRERIEKGKCRIPDCDMALVTQRFCELHRQRDLARAKRQQHASVDNGQCSVIGCENPLQTAWYCKHHQKEKLEREQANRERKARKEILQIAGIEL